MNFAKLYAKLQQPTAVIDSNQSLSCRKMNRVPATLLYLAIYNPSLRPPSPVPEDDEDAEEQAHILFYTSRERAVSRDRMLRQIGLAKALINFAE
jgi:hypothetical protein